MSNYKKTDFLTVFSIFLEIRIYNRVWIEYIFWSVRKSLQDGLYYFKFDDGHILTLDTLIVMHREQHYDSK